MDKSQLQLRSIQTRAFDTPDRERTLRTIIATMQDLGFVIDDANYTLGSVTGTKLDNFRLRMTATVRPRGTTQLLVRASMQFNLVQVDDPEPYQQFFTALGRAMFLEAQQAPETTPPTVQSATSPQSHVTVEKMEVEQSKGAKVEPQLTPTEVRDLLARADSSMKKGNYDAAIKEYQAALNVDVSNRTAQEGLSRARSVKQAAAKSTHWLMGKWVGTREHPWYEWDATIRITSYDQATHAFKGDGYLVDKGGGSGFHPPRTDLVIKVVIDEKGRVVMTTHHSSGSYPGSSFTFNLKRERDGRLSGTGTHGGSGRLTLEKKQ